MRLKAETAECVCVCERGEETERWINFWEIQLWSFTVMIHILNMREINCNIWLISVIGYSGWIMHFLKRPEVHFLHLFGDYFVGFSWLRWSRWNNSKWGSCIRQVCSDLKHINYKGVCTSNQLLKVKNEKWVTPLTSSLSHSYFNHLALLFIFLTNLVLLKLKSQNI